LNAFLQALQGVGVARVLMLLMVTASVIGLLGYFGTRLTQPPMTILYGDLDPKDAGQIVSRLETMAVPYELRAGGTQIFVPSDKALRLRMAMAGEGLPKDHLVGQTQLLADLPHLVLEQVAQRFDQRELHVLR